jgi:protein O-mannosyl-transferase
MGRKRQIKVVGRVERATATAAHELEARHATSGESVIETTIGAHAKHFAMMAILLLCATLAAYLPALRGGLVWDDEAHITRPELRSLDGLGQIWFKLGATQQYYPLLHTAFWLEHKIWGDATVGYHLVNVVLHTSAACLFALILLQLSIRGAWVGAFIFALHPVAVESVAWISEQKNTLSAVFYLSAMLIYLRYDDEKFRRRQPSSFQYYLSFALFIAALLSKSVTATLPAALLVLIWWRRGRLSWNEDVLPLIPWFTVGVAGGLFTAWVEGRYVGAEGSAFTLSLVQRCLIAGRVVWFYIGKLIWPVNLAFIYPRWEVSAFVWWQYLFPAALIGVVLAAWTIRSRTRTPLTVLLLFVGTLFPALGFFNAYPFIYSFVADHFQYLASLSVIALIAAGCTQKWRTATAAVAIGVLATLTWFQCRTYRNSETLYRSTIARSPSSWMAYNNLGLILQADGRVSEATNLYQQALALKPDYAEAHSNFGTVLYKEGRVPEAVTHFQQALSLKANYAEGQNNLGNALAGMNRLPEAISHLEEALRLKPNYAEANLNLGSALFRVGRTPEAIAKITEALRLNPNYAEAHNALGVIWYQTGRLKEAMAEFKEAVRLRPDFAAARRDLGEALWESGQSQEAMTEFKTVLRLTPDDAEAAKALGMAYYASGRVDEATAPLQELLRLKPDHAEAHNHLGFVLQVMRKADDSVAHFREAVRLNPAYAEAHFNLGNSLLILGRRNEAIAEFRAAVQSNADFAEAHDHLGAALYVEGRFGDAATAFAEAVRLKPDLASAKNNLDLARRAMLASGQSAGGR